MHAKPVDLRIGKIITDRVLESFENIKQRV